MEERGKIEKRMSYEVSLVWLLLSSSVQWSLPPWESAVWTTPLMEGGWGSEEQLHTKLIPPLQAVTYQQEEEEEYRNARNSVEKEKGIKKTRFQLNHTGAVSANGGGGQGGDREEDKLKERAAGEGKSIGEEVSRGKKITLGDGSIVFEPITPTQAFSRQQEEELNGPSGGGQEGK
ncbi:hypothetical protein PBY51_001940 [Eleginops maclovinus]|uniref:Uncharacterized protein n=1 Tax=Eleginops maclovinus TaxID=56733 RepID=A0AAN7WYG8_ELEMC|nr:hypothetical protein PBY51_001940 [Eleginops maclovinus]